MGVCVWGKEGGVGGETPRDGEALVKDYGSSEEFLTEELEALEVGEGD